MNLVTTVNGRTALYGLIGCPVEHTKSPFIHNTLFRELDINGVYIPVQVKQGELEAAVKGLRAQNFSGFNVTVPYKKDVIKYLDDISNDALLMGAVNTVKNINGRLKGYNTDAEGFSRDLKESFGTDFAGKRVMLLGAGGTARALSVKLAAEGVKNLTIANRTLENAKKIEVLISDNFGKIATSVTPEQAGFYDILKANDIIINTTPVGMSTFEIKTPFDFKFEFEKRQLVYDVIYAPEKTEFLRQAEESGCKIKNGFGMLINQGISAFEIWTGKVVSKNSAVELLKLINKLEEL